MKKIFLIPLICAPVLFGFNNLEIKIEDKRIFQKQVELKPKPLDSLIEALIQVESSGDSLAVGDTHLGSPSIGSLQIRPVMVREVNRILQLQGYKKRYKLKDRKSRKKSIEMFYVWKNFHHKDSDFETIARCWNGGSSGYKMKATEKYWKKVKSKLN